ncbi:MAG TPA: DNA repair protein [Lachnospiraceae bacterium]|nr:DNA repair protein [Lachnospiraceae bacterium]
MSQRIYLCIDLKSFYASVECVERGLDPMKAKLVVADPERSEKTICLAITPAMKALGIKNRCRIFEIPQNVKYEIATPRMQKYIDYAAEIYGIYLKYIAKEDIYVYSIDEAFMDVTDYLALYQMSARELGQRIMSTIKEELGIIATCGIGTNLYLTKVALDISAKHSPDFIGELDEKTYQKTLWNHKPLTDFWRIGPGIAKRLAGYGILTMGDIAHANEDLLYQLFGIDAELLIDHAWGREPVTLPDIKGYTAQTNCLTSGQVLMRDYQFEEAKLVAKEMMDLLCLDLVEKKLVTKSITLHVGYSNKLNVPSAHGTTGLNEESNADMVIIPAITALFEKIVNPNYPVKRMNISCNHVIPEEFHQYSFFSDATELEKNRKIQKAVLEIKHKFGKNAILKGMNFEEGAMTKERNHQIGGHKSGE